MKEIRIEIENIKLADLGIDQPIEYRTFRFKESQLVGYWISKEAIVFYIGAQTFNCKICQENIDLLDSILNESSSSNNNL